MANQGKVWDIREAYKLIRANNWSRGNIGVAAGGNTPSNSNVIDFVILTTAGNATDFGDLSFSKISGGAGTSGSTVKGLVAFEDDDAQSFTFTSKGNSSDFGTLSVSRGGFGIGSNNIKTCMGGGASASAYNTIDFFINATTGNAKDFGDLNDSFNRRSATNSNTRMLISGGETPGTNYNTTDFIDFATTGNASDFGDLTQTEQFLGSCNSNTKGVFAGGTLSNVIQFFTFATTGNATDYGDLTASTSEVFNGLSNSVKGCFAGGKSPSITNKIDSINIASTGNATDFGDLTVARAKAGGTNNGHGGIALGQDQRPSVTYMPGSGRAIICGGPPSPLIETFNISTLGNTVSFGSLILNAENWGGGCGNATRMLAADGGAASGYTTQISAIELASFGNASDFGDSTLARANQGAFANSTRGVWGGGYFPSSPNYSNVIDYVTIATFGNATDFGDLTSGGNGVGGTANSTRGLFGPRGPGSGIANIIDYVTIGSTGNATDFGDASVSRAQSGMGASSTRGLLGGGATPSKSNVIDYVTIDSTGNATDFGDLTVAASARFCATNNTRAVWGGGYSGSPTQTNILDYVTIASTGNAADFGDIASGARGNIMASSDSHGGLQSA